MIKNKMKPRIGQTRIINALVFLYEAVHANSHGYGSAWHWYDGENYACCALWLEDFIAYLKLMGIELSSGDLSTMTKSYRTYKKDFVSIMKDLDLNSLRAFFAFANGRHIQTLNWKTQLNYNNIIG